MSSPTRVVVVGAGDRGTSYANWIAENPERASVVGVVEPVDARRQTMAAKHGVAESAVFTDWPDLMASDLDFDAALVCTLDSQHVEPALALLGAGKHLLLEKPMAPTLDECEQITNAAREAGVVFAVAHVLRYTPYTRAIKELVDGGAIGEIMSVQHMEPVGNLHFAHSFVRGRWRNEAESSFMLLAKSCHDIDWLHYLVGEPMTSVASYGRLSYFRPENQPPEATDRCVTCPLIDTCVYSAPRFYLHYANQGRFGWPVSTITDDLSVEGVQQALENGPFGRCVWACDNDVVDHQVVAFEFAGGQTGTFVMTAFNEGGHRRTSLFGTAGELQYDDQGIRVYDFATRTWRDEAIPVYADMDAGAGHAGGDAGLMSSFIEAVQAGDPSLVRSGADATWASHRAVFEAERARHERRVIELG